MRTLIVGTDSYIGSSIEKLLKANGNDTIGTTRREESVNKNTIYLDLEKPEAQWPEFPNNIDCAFFAASITKQKFCEENPKLSKHINVIQTIKLIDSLTQSGIHVVFPSTNIVLGCETPNQTIDNNIKPLSGYAQSKASVENTYRGNSLVTIARLPKVLDSSNGVLKEWFEALQDDEHITAYSNMFLSPASCHHVCKFLLALIKYKNSGVWHISGDRNISYFDLAVALCDHIQKNRAYVIEKKVKTTHEFALPLYPQLDCSITAQELGIEAQSLHDLLEDCFPKHCPNERLHNA